MPAQPLRPLRCNRSFCFSIRVYSRAFVAKWFLISAHQRKTCPEVQAEGSAAKGFCLWFTLNSAVRSDFLCVLRALCGVMDCANLLIKRTYMVPPFRHTLLVLLLVCSAALAQKPSVPPAAKPPVQPETPVAENKVKSPSHEMTATD